MEQNLTPNENEEVYFIRSSVTDRFMESGIEKGIYNGFQPGWSNNEYGRVKPANQEKVVVVSMDRIFMKNDTGLNNLLHYIEKLAEKQKSASNYLESRYKAAKSKYEFLTNTIKSIKNNELK